MTLPRRIFGLSITAWLLTAIALAGPESQTAPPTAFESSEVLTLIGQSERMARSISSLVGTAISPLVGVGVIGSLGWLRAAPDARALLPWYHQPWLWGSVLVLVGLVALKDSVGGIVPLVKKPLDALELMENKLSALIALPIVLHVFFRDLTQADLQVLIAPFEALLPTAHASIGDLSSTDLTSFSILGVVATIIFTVVWMSGHVVNVLVFLSPFGFLDSLLKIARLGVLSAVVGSALLHPGFGIATSLIVIAIAFVLFGWSLRFATLGAVMAADVLRGRDDDPATTRPAGLRAFSCAGFKRLPPRTLGRLRRDGDVLEFRYRPLLILPGRVLHLSAKPDSLAIGEGLLTPTLIGPTSTDCHHLLFRFAPRYRTRVAALCSTLGAGGVRDVSVRRSLNAAWSFLRAWVGGEGEIASKIPT